MFPLGGSDFPKDTATLHAALAQGLAPLGLGASAVALDGAFPTFAAVRVDLTGAQFHRGLRPSRTASDANGGFFSRVAEITAAPARFESVPFQLSARAEDAVFAFGKDADGRCAVILQNCARGELEVAIAIADIEAALLALANEAASEFGASVKSIRISMESEKPRSAAITAVAVASALMTKATLTLRGRLEIDEKFNARLSGATCTGDGMIANLAASQLRPRLAVLEGQNIGLGDVLPRGLNISSIALETGGPCVRLRTAFRAGATC